MCRDIQFCSVVWMEQSNSPQRQEDTAPNLREVLDQLRSHHKNKDTASLSESLLALKAKFLNSKSNIRRFKDVQGLKFLCALLSQYSSEYATRPNASDTTQLLSLVVGIVGNCCNLLSSVRSEVRFRSYKYSGTSLRIIRNSG